MRALFSFSSDTADCSATWVSIDCKGMAPASVSIGRLSGQRLGL